MYSCKRTEIQFRALHTSFKRKKDWHWQVDYPLIKENYSFKPEYFIGHLRLTINYWSVWKGIQTAVQIRQTTNPQAKADQRHNFQEQKVHV